MRIAWGIALAVLLAGPSLAKQDGIDSTVYFAGDVGCGSPALEGEGCHTSVASGDVTVTIEGPAEIDPASGAGVFVATASSPLQDRLGAGINILLDPDASSSNCVLETLPTPQNDQLRRDSETTNPDLLTHRDAGNPPPLGSLGVFEYTFLLSGCTVPGSVRLAVAMNLFDGDGSEQGDVWNRSERTITVPAPQPGTAAALALAGLAGLGWRRRASSR